jgi:hypothetical protein
VDRPRYIAAQTKEREARRSNPVTVEVTGKDYEDWKFALMLLRRVAGNTRDGDLDRVERRLTPLLKRIADAYREVPEVKAAINEQRDLLGLPPLD